MSQLTRNEMSETTSDHLRGRVDKIPRIPVLALGISLSIFLPLSYLMCLLLLFLFPHVPLNHSVLIFFVPSLDEVGGYDLLIGVIEAFVGGWWMALGFGTLYNFIVARLGR
jgi:hypothetical protein